MLLRFFKVESTVIEIITIEFSIPDYNDTIIKNIFKHWTSWSCVPYAMVHRSVLQWTKGERVPLSRYERTFVAVLHFHFMTAFHRRPKRRRFFPFPNNHRRPNKVFFLFLQRFFSLFSTFSIRPSIPLLFYCPTGHESRRCQCQSRIKYLFTTMKISIWIQSNVTLNRNDKILSIGNKNLFERHFQWNSLLNSNKHLIDSTLSTQADEGTASIAAFICVFFRGIYVMCYFDVC